MARVLLLSSPAQIDRYVTNEMLFPIHVYLRNHELLPSPPNLVRRLPAVEILVCLQDYLCNLCTVTSGPRLS